MKKYLITTPDFYTDTPSIFSGVLESRIIKHEPDYVLYRDKLNPNYEILASYFIKVCTGKNVKSFIHQNVDLAKQLEATGVHLTSQDFEKITYAKNLGLEVIVSTHTHEEVLKAQELQADAVTYGPIFPTPNKGEPKGIKDLEELLAKCSINVFALGGIIGEEHLECLEEVKPYGFASIRYFF